MARETDPADFLDREPDERLLGADAALLPDTLGRPEAPVPSPARGRIVGLGATLTGVTLVAGVAVILLGLVEAIAGGIDAVAIVLVLVGLALAGTHWGWVHIAEISADGLDARRNQAVLERNHEWLGEIEPYSRWSVSTHVEADGSITILTVCHRPVVSGADRFTFVREVAEREVHSGEEPAAAVADRAEELRRRAAGATSVARARFDAARDADERARLEHADEQERLAAVRAASEALSEQINTHMRDPPLTE